MCRWITYISNQPILLEDILINAPHPITLIENSNILFFVVHRELIALYRVHDHFIPGISQSINKLASSLTAFLDIIRGQDFDDRNSPINMHGFGVTWYTNTRGRFDSTIQGPRPALYKTTALPITDPTFISICGNTASKCISAHVRAATRPPVVQTNNHPFVFGRHSFMHNGGISNFHEIRLELLKKTSPNYAALIHGNTDSEHFAALYFTHLGDIENHYTAKKMRSAIESAIKDVLAAQTQVLGKEVANSMNICTTDGQSLVALRWRNHPTQEPPSLYVSYTAAASLNRIYKDAWNSDRTVSGAEELTKNVKLASEQQQKTSKKNPHGWHVMIASEPTSFIEGQWLLLKKGQFIMVDAKEGPLRGLRDLLGDEAVGEPRSNVNNHGMSDNTNSNMLNNVSNNRGMDDKTNYNLLNNHGMGHISELNQVNVATYRIGGMDDIGVHGFKNLVEEVKIDKTDTNVDDSGIDETVTFEDLEI